MCPSYISKINSNCEKKILLMILNKEKKGWHYLAVKKLSTLWTIKTSWCFLLLKLPTFF